MTRQEYIEAAAKHLFMYGTIATMTDRYGVTRHGELVMSQAETDDAISEAADIASAVYRFLYGDKLDPEPFTEQQTEQAFSIWKKHKENQK